VKILDHFRRRRIGCTFFHPVRFMDKITEVLTRVLYCKLLHVITVEIDVCLRLDNVRSHC